MKRNLLLIVTMVISLGYVFSQDLTINFTAQGVSTQIDEVNAINLLTEESVTLPGDGTLILHSTSTAIKEASPDENIFFISNPNSHVTKLFYSNIKSQKVKVQLTNMSGRVISSYNNILPKGTIGFNISSHTDGVYILSIITQDNISSIKVFQKGGTQNQIEYLGIENRISRSKRSDLKSGLTDYVLNYTPGDVISFIIKSGENITIVNDIPESSKTITAEIVICKDYDGNNYKVAKIGDQTWMAENLRTTHYPDGNPIPNITDNTLWWNLANNNTDDAYCWYVNDKASYSIPYGAYYTWAAAMGDNAESSNTNPSGVQGACPDGWHMPSNAEWNELMNYLGGPDIAGGKLKESGTSHWRDPNVGGTNESGFGAVPAGNRGYYGAFSALGAFTVIWSATEYSGTQAYALNIGQEFLWAELYQSDKSYGVSARCVKD